MEQHLPIIIQLHRNRCRIWVGLYQDFIHDIISVPGTHYSVSLTKTNQILCEGPVGLILDIDVFIQNLHDYTDTRVVECLEDMRWVKNKIFYSSVTEKALVELR